LALFSLNFKIEDKQRQRDILRDQLLTAERRSAIAQQEKEDLANAMEQVNFI
jgi:hypothetical protein